MLWVGGLGEGGRRGRRGKGGFVKAGAREGEGGEG